MWITHIPCPFCRLRGDAGATHRITHDDLSPPDPSKTWGVRCPCTHRFQVIDPAKYQWEWESRYVGYHTPLQREPVITEW